MTNSNRIDLEAFKLITSTVFDSDNPETLGAQLTRMLVGMMEIKGAAFFVVNPVSETLEILATDGLSTDYKNKGPILVDQSIKLESNLKPVVIQDIEKSGLLQYPEKAKREGIRAIVSLPIKLKGKLVGALRVYHSDVWDITENDMGFLQVIAVQLAVILRFFRLSAAVRATKETMADIHPVWL